VRIAVFDAGDSIMDSATQALKDLGSDSHLVRVELDQRLMLQDESRVVSAIEDLSPDVLFLHNFWSLLPHFEDSPKGRRPIPSPLLKLVEREGVHVVAWFLDDPLQSSLHYWLLRRFSDSGLLSVLLLDRTWVEPCLALGVAAAHLPHCTDPSVFSVPQPAGPTPERLCCEVSIVGDSRRSEMIGYRRYLEHSVGQLFDKEEAEKVLFAINSAILLNERTVNADSEEIVRSNLGERYQRMIAEENQEGWADFFAPIEWIGSCRQRWRLANLVADQGLAVFGDPQWPAILKRPDVYRGPIDYKNELPTLYASDAIHLMVNRIQVRTAVTQRVYDIAAAGGFSLSDYRPDLDHCMPDGIVATYRNLTDVSILVDKFRAEPELRREMASRAREVVLENHTYRHRMTTLLEHLQTRGRH
jgi:spore maturation protein CgeB